MNHISLIDLVPFLSDRHLVMSLLKATPSPFRTHCSRPLAEGTGYRFTVEDIGEFLAERRVDLAELVLESTTDVNLLYAVSQMPVSVPVLKAICRNRSTPGDLLAHLYCDSRVSVSKAAQSALAGWLGVMVGRSGGIVADFLELVNCPDEDLPSRITRVRTAWPVRALDYGLACVLQRPSGVTAEAWQAISGPDWAPFERFSQGQALKGVVAHPLMTDKDLETLLSRMRFRGNRSVVLDALIARSEVMSTRWQDLFSERLESAPGYAKDWSLDLSEADASSLFASGEPLAYAAVYSGALPAADAVARVDQWTKNLGSSRSNPLVNLLLRHPGVSGGLLDACINVSGGSAAILSALAGNPNLSEQQEAKLMGETQTRASLAANPRISASSAAALAASSLDPASQFGRNTWYSHGVLVSLFSNEGVSEELRMSLPVSALGAHRFSQTAPLAEAMASVAGKRLGTEVDAWSLFLGMLPEWEGSLGDLIEVARVL